MEVQKRVRSTNAATQDPEDVEQSTNLHEKGALLQPHQPENILARIVLDCPKGPSGQSLAKDDDSLKDFQDSTGVKGNQ